MTEISSLCVYCGSASGRDPRYRATAERFGAMMAERGIDLVYGGGNIGLMKVVADAVMAGGGRVIGIIPHFLLEKEPGHPGITRLEKVDSMHVRKQRMFELSDGFVVLPGGMGTLDETMEIITWRQLGRHDKPIVILNDGGYWDPLIDLVRTVIRDGFARPETAELITVVDSPEAAFEALAAAPAPRTEPCAPEQL